MERFPEVGARETRSVTVTHRQDLPDGEYGFLELYCDEAGCDCLRVVIDVLRPETGWSKIWATIGYGWESLDFYLKWGGAASDPTEVKGPYLDRLNPQSKYSSALLDLFRAHGRKSVVRGNVVRRAHRGSQPYVAVTAIGSIHSAGFGTRRNGTPGHVSAAVMWAVRRLRQLLHPGGPLVSA
jgi:hypothetical protein